MKTSVMEIDSDAQETRRRLLNAAGEVFADHGFRGTTVRAICQRAKANIAAVNYHFRDKQGLYKEVLRFAHQCAAKPEWEMAEIDQPEETLREFIRHFLNHLFDDGRPAWHGRLMAREMVEPTDALHSLVKQDIQPRHKYLRTIVQAVAGRKASEKEIRQCAQSVIGQCLFYLHARPMLERLSPEDRYDAKGIEERAEHIFQFSLAAIRHMNFGKSIKTNGVKR